MRADDLDAARWIVLGDHDVREALRGPTVLRVPVRVWDGPAGERDERQPGIPRDAANVRMCGSYLKCDSPAGSSRASSRVECPYGDAFTTLAVRERVYIAPPYFGHASDANAVDRRGRARVVGYAASMDADSVRCAADYGVRITYAPRMPRWAVRLMLRVVGVDVRQLVGVWHWEVAVERIDPVPSQTEARRVEPIRNRIEADNPKAGT